MKSRIINLLIIISLFTGGRLCAQETKGLTKESYLKKARRDQTIGIVAAGASVVFLAGGIIYDRKDGEGIGETLGNGINSAIGYGGAVTFGLTSIGFFIGSGHQRRKAARIEPTVYRENLLIPSFARGRAAGVGHVGVVIRF